MTNDIDISLIGDDELLAILQELDYKTQHRIIKRVVNDAANIYVKAAKRKIPKRTDKGEPTGFKWHPPGMGRKSIMKKAGKSRKTATVFIGPRTGTNNYLTDAWYLKFFEYGTKHSPPTYALTGAYAANKKRVEDNMFNSIRRIIQRILNKLK